MRPQLIISGVVAGAVAMAGLATAIPGASASGVPANTSGGRTVHVCAAHPAPGHATCLAIAVTGADGVLRPSSTPLASAFTPMDIQQAYGLAGLSSSGRTVAIVDAYGYSTLESDLATYRSNYGLPACTIANGCLQILDEHGGHNLPPNDSGWDVEQALDVDAVSAACPDCKIVMLQGAAATFADLETAEDTAAGLPGVVAISNSYVGGDMHNNAAYDHKNVAVVAGTGDGGFEGGLFPANNTHVVAVGGTSVFRDGSTRGYHETAWGGSGSGCGVNRVPKWQTRVDTTCPGKATSDVSAAADPNNGGLNIYIGGWEQVGGTSEATPLIAAVYALSGQTRGYPARYPYKRASDLYDITSGSNGDCGPPLCDAGPGWDGPTGMGTPNGVAGF
jgi:subtilase family serine protease